MKIAKWFELDTHFIDPPFRLGKYYRFFDDNQPEEEYWVWLEDVLSKVWSCFKIGKKNIEELVCSKRKLS